ncbi:uncharacterized protein VTP21DRAFT_6628 [Calcarisporiella thermophila]|uniref:uncharacterized protein n=1 Tax=Calcarisporiella thermophila TaxID=911321 RepID=UPI003742346C
MNHDTMNHVEELVSLSKKVLTILQQHSERLRRQRSSNVHEEPIDNVDSNQLIQDLALAERSLDVLEVRRQLRTAINKLVECNFRVHNSPSSEGEAQLQLAIDNLQSLIRKAIQGK